MPDIPVACTLSPEALQARRDGLLSDLLRRAEHHEFFADGVRVRFAAQDDTLATITRAVDAERRCCRFLRFVIAVEPDGGAISLDLSGPPGARDFIAALLNL